MIKIIFGAIAAAAVTYVIIPLMGRKVSWVDAEDPDDERIRELELEKKINLKALKDIEFELASGKINEEDYNELKGHYLRKVSRIMDRLEELTGEEKTKVEAHHGGRGKGDPDEDEGSGEKENLQDEDDDDLDEDEGDLDEDEGDPDEDEDDPDEDEDDPDEDEDDPDEDWEEEEDPDEDWDEEDDDEDEEWDDEEEYELRSVKGPIVVVLALALIVGMGVAFFQMGKRSALKAPAGPAAVATLPSPSSDQAGLEHLVRYVQENPWNVTSHIVLGEYYFGIGNTNLALAHFVSAEEVAPGDSRVLSNLGKAYRKLGNPDQAIEKLEAAADAQPESLDHLFQMGLIYSYDKGDRKQARALFEEILSRQPNEDLQLTVMEELEKLKDGAG